MHVALGSIVDDPMSVDERGSSAVQLIRSEPAKAPLTDDLEAIRHPGKWGRARRHNVKLYRLENCRKESLSRGLLIVHEQGAKAAKQHSCLRPA